MNDIGDALALAANVPLAARRPAAPIRVAEMTAADRLTGFLGNLLKSMGIKAPSASDSFTPELRAWTAGRLAVASIQRKSRGLRANTEVGEPLQSFDGRHCCL
jgi:hypothetical protein